MQCMDIWMTIIYIVRLFFLFSNWQFLQDLGRGSVFLWRTNQEIWVNCIISQVSMRRLKRYRRLELYTPRGNLSSAHRCNLLLLLSDLYWRIGQDKTTTSSPLSRRRRSTANRTPHPIQGIESDLLLRSVAVTRPLEVHTPGPWVNTPALQNTDFNMYTQIHRLERSRPQNSGLDCNMLGKGRR